MSDEERRLFATGAYSLYVTEKKGGLTKYHTPYMRRHSVESAIIRKAVDLSKKPTAFLYDKGENYELVMSTVYRSPERLSF